MHHTREELLRHLELRWAQGAGDRQAGFTMGWVLDELEEIGLLAFTDKPMEEPLPLGVVVTASTRTTPAREFWTKFTNVEQTHSSQRWINERGIPASWADLVNPRIATPRNH